MSQLFLSDTKELLGFILVMLTAFGSLTYMTHTLLSSSSLKKMYGAMALNFLIIASLVVYQFMIL